MPTTMLGECVELHKFIAWAWFGGWLLQGRQIFSPAHAQHPPSCDIIVLILHGALHTASLVYTCTASCRVLPSLLGGQLQHLLGQH